MDSQASGGSGGMSFGIPDALSFDRIITGGTCPVSVHYLLPPHTTKAAASCHCIPTDQHPSHTSTCIAANLIRLADSMPSSHAQHATS